MRSTPAWTDSLGHSAAALAASFRTGLAGAFAAWPILLGRALFYGVLLLVIVALWDKVASARLAGTLATQLPAQGLATYVGVTEWITLSVTAIQLKLEDDIRLGGLEPHLLRPKSYIAQTIAQAMGGMSARLITLGVAAIIMLAFSGRAWPPPMAFVYVPVLGFLGATVGVLIYALVGLTAFWVRKVLPFLLIVQKLMFILGGLFAPIALYPPWLRHLSEVTPFAAHLAFAGAQVLRPSGDAFWPALAWEAFWLAALSLAIALTWRAGLAKVLKKGVV